MFKVNFHTLFSVSTINFEYVNAGKETAAKWLLLNEYFFVESCQNERD